MLPATIPEARFAITKVYVGPDVLLKRTFTCDLVPHQITVADPLARLHINVGFEKGVEGLWWVKYDAAGSGSLQPVREAGDVDALGLRPFPYQKMLRDGPRLYKTPKDAAQGFQEGLAWADAAAQVYRAATDQERAKLLRAYAAEHNLRAAWASAWLAQSQDKELVGFFRTLIADTKHTLENQVILDRALVMLDGKNWDNSKERAALHQRWRDDYRGPLLPIPLEILKAQRRWVPAKSPFGVGP